MSHINFIPSKSLPCNDAPLHSCSNRPPALNSMRPPPQAVMKMQPSPCAQCAGVRMSCSSSLILHEALELQYGSCHLRCGGGIVHSSVCSSMPKCCLPSSMRLWSCSVEAAACIVPAAYKQIC
eukprot:scaffold37126_cov19-Tisochrysis_lutea.AAC.2